MDPAVFDLETLSATASRKYRSCDTARIVPDNLSKYG
jgi:hypothetical protein